MTEVKEIALKDIRSSEDNPRREVGDVEELAASVKALGILEPVLVTPNGKGFTVVAGERRLAAAKKAGLKAIPAIVRDLDDRQMAEIMIVENLQREDLSPLEEAHAFRRLLDLGYKQEEIAARIGRSQSHISKRLALLELPERAAEAVHSGGIPLESALHLTKLKEHPELIEKLLDRTKQGIEIRDYHIRTELDGAKRQEKVAKAKADLKAKGIRVISAGPKWGSRKDGVVLLDGQKQGWNQNPRLEGVKASQHKKEPCHAASVDGYDGKVLSWCTKPERHAKKGESEVKATKIPSAEKGESTSAKKQRQQEEALNEALENRETPRLEFMRGLVKAKVRREPVLEFLTLQLLDDGAPGYGGLLTQLASPILRDEPKPKPGSSSPPLSEIAGRELDRMALVVALSIGEEQLQEAGAWGDWKGPVITRHLTFLVSYGYELSEAEREKLRLSGAKWTDPVAVSSEPDDDEEGSEEPEPVEGDGEVSNLFWEED